VNLGELDVAPLGGLREVFEVLTHPCVAAIRASPRCESFNHGIPDDFGVRERDVGFGVAPVPRVKREQGQLHVLLRHRPTQYPAPGFYFASGSGTAWAT
jgi:hypothetical protein